MIDFSWREDLSESFGKVKRPVAEIFIKDKEGSWRAFTMIIDSGADASVMNRSFGELFGHDIEKGSAENLLRLFNSWDFPGLSSLIVL